MIDLTSAFGRYAALTVSASVPLAYSVSKVFDWFDGGMSPSARERLSSWLRSVPGEDDAESWANVFPRLIDRVFGEKPLSWSFFLRPSAVSIIAVTTVGLLMWAIYGSEALLSDESASWADFSIFPVSALVVNCVPDYFSLLVSRWIVRAIAKRPAPLRTSILLVIDLMATTALYVIAVSCWVVAFGLLFNRFFWGSRGHELLADTRLIFWQDLRLVVRFSDPGFNVFYFASLFTSIWVWLYVLASTGIRLVHNLKALWGALIPVLSVDDKPMQAIGRVAGVLAAGAYLLGCCGVWLTHRI